ncbi:MAG: phosphonate ABC transporter, permease protein PhnE [Candidatus Tectomicrobia bacterium]|nr:phosphonate ABC transporter, permease protein PhnE [Candidatus Tectomicrobia bacterium]
MSSAPLDPQHPRQPLPYLKLLLALVAFGAAWRLTEMQPSALFAAEGRRNMLAFIGGMFPPDLSVDFLQRMLGPLLTTIQLSIAGMVLAILIGLALALPAARTLRFAGVLHEVALRRRRRWLLAVLPYAGARGLLNLLRAVPELVWALIFVRAVGLGAFPGVLAIGVAYGGILGKIYAEIIEGVAPQPLETLQSTGAGKLAVFCYGIVPQALPHAVSYTLYRWECAIRASAVLGFVGAGGIGQEIELSMRMFNFHEVMTLLMMVFGLVAITDLISAAVRRRLR